ncbi:MAG: phosphate ABC transporter permease PstA [Rhodocyclaceae bacterium]|nr:phosphate ABC transporter permease PstA [Rhodocyclaceae bacterium]
MDEGDDIHIGRHLQRRRRLEIVFVAAGLLCLILGMLTLVTLFAEMARQGLPRLGIDFLSRYPSRHAELAGILPAWVGSLAVMVVTAATAVPLGVGAAVYLEEYAPRNLITALIEINLTNLAGMPSIVFGLMALGIFVFEFGLGRNILTAGLTLALLILPIIIVTAREALRTVPDSLREAAFACGASPWQALRDHVVPAAGPGILTGIIIGLARAIGETAPLIALGAVSFVSFLPESPIRGEFPFISFDWLSAPFTALPVQMFNWTTRPDPDFRANAAAAAFVLVAMALAINGLAIWLRHRMRREARW